MTCQFIKSVKKIFWRVFEPFFPTFRDAWVALGFISHNVRQPYLYGTIKPGLNRQDLKKHLSTAGFDNDYLAWIDPDEILNMRKVVNGDYQYHVRLFIDGEVRAHYEFTPESHPFKHLYDVGLTDGADYLKPLLANLVQELPEPSLSLRNNTQGETS